MGFPTHGDLCDMNTLEFWHRPIFGDELWARPHIADSLLLPLLGTGLSAKVLYSALEDEAPRTRFEQDSTKVM
jgi:hypothetical protein